jgi:DUF4097 and DUF4098 domain-containing protein YvlB
MKHNGRLGPLPMGVVVLVALAGAACEMDVQASSASGSFERTLAVDGPVDLEVSTGSGSIRVAPGGATEVRVVGRMRAYDGVVAWSRLDPAERIKGLIANPPVEQSGNTIRIGDVGDRELRRHVSISYELLVPPQTKLRSRSGSGDLEVAAISGPVDARTGSGTIQIGKIRGQASATTGSGDISVLAASGIDARAGSGSVRAENITGPVSVRTGSGDISVDGEPSDAWEIRAGSGDVNIRVKEGSSFDLNARTGSGGIHTDPPILVSGSLSRNHLQGRVGNGGQRVDVMTGSGSITLATK